jgi:hypothetical protein
MRLGTLRDRWILFLGTGAGLTALVLAAANQIQNAGRAMTVSLAFFVVFGLAWGYRRFGNRFWLALPKHKSLRFVTVFISGIAFTLVALFSAALPGKVIFALLAWPVAIMLWIFPPPCFDRGPGMEPFCEGTPIQLLAGGLGLIVLLIFYWCVSWLALRRALRVRSAG